MGRNPAASVRDKWRTQPIVFLGAGASHDSGLPLADQAVATLTQHAFERAREARHFRALANAMGDGAWPRFETAVSTFAEFLPTAPLRLIATMAGIGMSSTHRLLASVVARPTLWLTTNFDDQIERALSERGQRLRVIVSRREMAGLRREDLADRHTVVKLHGDATASRPESDLGVRIEQILRDFPEGAADAISRLASRRPLWVIGYAARDPDLRPLLRLLLGRASSVRWINLGPATPEVRAVLRFGHSARYSGAGAPRALEEALATTAPAPTRDPYAWLRAVARWVATLPRLPLRQALASLCLDAASERGREISRRLNAPLLRSRGHDRVVALARQIDLVLRDTKKPRPRAIARLRDSLVAISRARRCPPRVAVEAAVNAALVEWRTGKVSTVVEELSRLPATYIRSAEPKLRIRYRYMLGLGEVYQGASRLRRGLALFRRALAESQRAREPVLEIEAAVRLAIGLMRAGQPNAAITLLRRAQRVEHEIGNRRRQLVLLVNLAEAYRIARHFGTAAELNVEVIERARELRDDELVMNAANNLGLCHIAQGRVHSAHDALRRARRLAASRGGENFVNTVYNFAWLHFLRGEWSRAAPLLGRAAVAYARCGARERELGALAQQGFCYLRLGRLRAAERLAAKIMEAEAHSTSIFGVEVRAFRAALEGLSSASLAEQRVKIHQEFARDPEQRFQLLAALADRLQTAPQWLHHAVVKDARVAATQSGLRVFDEQLAKLR